MGIQRWFKQGAENSIAACGENSRMDMRAYGCDMVRRIMQADKEIKLTPAGMYIRIAMDRLWVCEPVLCLYKGDQPIGFAANVKQNRQLGLTGCEVSEWDPRGFMNLTSRLKAKEHCLVFGDLSGTLYEAIRGEQTGAGWMAGYTGVETVKYIYRPWLEFRSMGPSNYRGEPVYLVCLQGYSDKAGTDCEPFYVTWDQLVTLSTYFRCANFRLAKDRQVTLMDPSSQVLKEWRSLRWR